MAQQIVNTGIVANDGTGDPLRTSMQKVNNNFSEFYSVFVPAASNNVTASNNLTVTANVISNNIFANTKIRVGSAAGYDFGSLAVIEIDASQNTYIQSVIQNANSGTNATGDLVITADTGNDSVNFVDFGINSSTYSNTSYTIGGALDAYLYTSNSNLTIGTASAKEVIFHASGTLAANKVLTVNATAITVVNSISLVANGASGATGQVLTSNGSALYWSNPSVNVTAQYAFTNTQSFSNTITFGNSTSNATLTAAITLRQSNATVNASMNSNTVQIANSTGNIAITAASVTLSNTTVAFLVANSTGVYATVNAVFNSTNLLYTGNTTTQPTVTLANTGSFTIGNSTTTQTTGGITIANTAGNVSISTVSIQVGNSANATAIGGAIINTTAIAVGNSTAFSNITYASINTGSVSAANLTATTNTLTLGTSSVGAVNFANGYTRLVNGLLMQYGFIAFVNSTANVVTLPVAFVNIFSTSVTSNTVVSSVAVTAANNTTITLTANTTTNTGVYFTVIGK